MASGNWSSVSGGDSNVASAVGAAVAGGLGRTEANNIHTQVGDTDFNP